ncbi:MAG TPA: hypothetical protein ACFYEK_04295 [Candidatus Wunengus sp. YC60]|uniref:hypothetical protein n=1 Tax=Candidatus Wunengus sp. YC60 TaxID=3367697 RepID=UPI004026F207
MYRNTKEPICKKCNGYSVVEVFEPEVGFEVLMPCPACDKEIEDSLKDLLT